MSKIDRVLFMGSKYLGLRILEEMYNLAEDKLIGIVTTDDTNDARTKHTEILSFAKSKGLDIFIAKNKKHSEKIIEDLNPDLCIVVGWYWMISQTTLESVPFGFIGIHNSLLPKYRGGSPLVWAMIKGEKRVGLSLFSFTQGMDDGPIWAQASVTVDDHEYISSVLDKIESKAVHIIRSNFLKILNGDIEAVEQNHELATYCAQRLPSDGNIDWHKPAQEVFNFIRAQSEPYPGAFTYLEGEKMTIWRARFFERPYFGTPGQVARITNNEVFVICGDDHAIILEEVEIGEKREKPAYFIKSTRSRLSSAPKTQNY